MDPKLITNENLTSNIINPHNGLPDWEEIIKQTFELYKSKALKIICLYILAAFLAVLIVGVVIGIIFLYSILAKSLADQGALMIISILGIALGTLIAIFSAIYLCTWPIVASIFIIGNEVGIKDALKITRKIVWNYYWVNFLVGICILVGIILLVIPGIIFAIWLSLTGIVLIYENLGGVEACARSKQLVSKNFWWVVRKMVLITLISLVTSSVLQQFKDVAVVVILTPLINLLLAPFNAIYSYLIYKSLRD